MILEIDDKITVREIQQKFQQLYPFLKIEFADKPHSFSDATLKGHWYEPEFRLFSIARKPRNTYINIQSWHRTGDIEDRFQGELGLYVQIFRKERDRWIQTAGSDILTLEEQNEIGKESVEEIVGAFWLERDRF